MVRIFHRLHFKSFWLAVCACFCVCLCIPYLAWSAGASDVDAPEDLIYETEAIETVVDDGNTDNDKPIEITIVSKSDNAIGFDPQNIVSVDVVTSTNPVTPNNANGLKKIILQLIGNYDMVTSEYTYTSNNGYTNKQVTTEPDYAWMISAGIFIIVVFSVFRLFGGMLRARS